MYLKIRIHSVKERQVKYRRDKEKNLVVLNSNWKSQYELSSIDIMFISITFILMLSLYSSPTVSTEKDLETMANSIKNKEISIPSAHMVVLRKDFA